LGKVLRIQIEELSAEARLISRMIKMMTSLSELDLMIQDGRGKSQRFAETLIGQYYDYIYRLSVSILGGLSDADDVCQDTFIDALLYIDRYSPGTSLKAWLSKIALHKCLTVLRKRKLKISLKHAIQHDQYISQNSTSELVTQAEKRREIWSAVNSLNEKHRIPIILYYIYDLKIREIAAILDIPEGTVSSRLYYAVQKLNTRLQDMVED
jgi:RNA polymerase sigma-70 factor, ECF subfamily